jgi:hypothetical protein
MMQPQQQAQVYQYVPPSATNTQIQYPPAYYYYNPGLYIDPSLGARSGPQAMSAGGATATGPLTPQQTSTFYTPPNNQSMQQYYQKADPSQSMTTSMVMMMQPPNSQQQQHQHHQQQQQQQQQHVTNGVDSGNMYNVEQLDDLMKKTLSIQQQQTQGANGEQVMLYYPNNAQYGTEQNWPVDFLQKKN